MLASTGVASAASKHGKHSSAKKSRAKSSEPRHEVLKLGLQAVACAEDSGQPKAQRLALIDYSLSANVPRLWVYDLATGKVLFHERVAHGRGTGEAMAARFSNEPESFTSSLGLYRTLETYDGSNGYSLRLHGMEPGFNDRAYDRQIVMHGADYVSEDFIKASGRLGRSYGCPAVRREVAQPMIDSLKHGQYLFAYYPDAAWLKTSQFLACSRTGTLVKAASSKETAAAD